MNEIIEIKEQTIGSGFVQTVNARELHAALGVKGDFSHWIKRYLGKFVENQDYAIFVVNDENSKGRPRTEYALSLDMAKHVAMMSETDKSMEVRQYFIECERQAKSMDPRKALADPAMLRQTLLTYVEKVIELEAVVSEQAPKVAALDRIATADGSLCITDAAKHLQIRPKDLFDYLRKDMWIYRRCGNSHWLGYQVRIQQGLLEHKVTTTERPDGSEKIVTQVRITPKGLRRLSIELGLHTGRAA